jgi:oxygen-independent coproporphyrinogen-3 oxidase
MPRFIEALMAEMEMLSAQGLSFDTLYIGGGTPSVYDYHDIDQIVAAALQNFDLQPDSEITIEVNPGTTSIEQLKGCREAGINRINIGVQSFNQRHLDFLGRIHTAAESHKAITDADQAVFKNIGLDLIYGLPEQSRGDWLADLKQAVAYNPTHLSCYMLTYEKGTPLHSHLENGRIQALSDDHVRELFEATIEFLEGNGYFQYEIANFARLAKDPATHISRHNLKYWTRATYIGLGPSAHSFMQSRRYWNLSSVDQYLAAIESEQAPIAEEEVLNVEQEMIEAIYLGLRMTQGIDLIWLKQEFGIDFLRTFKDVVADLVAKNYMKADAFHAALTKQGRAFLDSIAAMFVTRDLSNTKGAQ